VIRLLLVGGMIEVLGGLSPAAQDLAVLGLLGLLAGVIFSGDERPLKRLLALIEALRPRRRR
jgi:hypothetical protein